MLTISLLKTKSIENHRQIFNLFAGAHEKDSDMGAWSKKIKDNDTTLDIYSTFFDRYNSGGNPTSISKSVKYEYADYFNDSDDRNNILFGLALAQWETKILEKDLFDEIKGLIESGNDLKVWQELGTDEKSLKNRKKELDKFLNQISKEKEKPKRRVRPKFEFSTKEIIKAISPDNKKELLIQDEYTNGQYVHTSGIMTWYSGGGAGIVYHDRPDCDMKVKWINSQTVEIMHDKEINFGKKETNSFFCGDSIEIIYKEQ